MEKSPIIFFDGNCGLCDAAVRWVLRHDKKKQFLFAPLQGKTASKELDAEIQKMDSLILLDYKKNSSWIILYRSKAVFRILRLLGGGWALIGSFEYLPSWLFDWMYRLLAKNRHKLYPKKCLSLPLEERGRFLD